MTRQEYMNALEAQLDFLPEETRDAALSFYGEMIDDRMEDGMDEPSAVAAMEDVEAIAGRLRAENPPAAEEKKEQPAPEPMRDDAMEFSSLADSVLRAARQALEKAPEIVSSGVESARQALQEKMPEAMEEVRKAVERVPDAVEEARKAVENAREEAAVSSGEKFGDYEQKILTCPAAALRTVSLTASDMPVRVEACEGDTATLIYYTCPQDPYIARFENGALTLVSEEKARSRRGFSFSFLADHIQLVWGKSSPTIELHLPADTLTDLFVHTGNGSIRVKDLSALCAVDLQTSNSRIALENIRCKSLEMKTSNGRLVLDRVEGKRFLHGKTSNSRIEAANAACGGDVTLITSNGRLVLDKVESKGLIQGKTSNSRIEAKCVISGESVSLITSNGGVTVDRVDAPDVTLRSSNSGISGLLPGREADWAIDSGTSNGHNSLPRQTAGSKRLSAHTSNGSIDIRFEG